MPAFSLEEASNIARMHTWPQGGREGEGEGQRQFEGRGEPTDRRTDRPSFFFLSAEGGRGTLTQTGY